MTAIGSAYYRATALVLWGLVVFLVASLIGGGRTAGEEVHRAGLVVDFGGQVETSCVEFSEDEISGSDLLRRSGLAVVFSDFGGGLGDGVCQIGDTGCSNPGDCFCQCHGADCAYWVYFALVDGAWQFQAVGPSTRRLRHGDVDAWRWGSPQNEPPPVVSFAEICPLPAEPPPDEPSGPPNEAPNSSSEDDTGEPAQGQASRPPPEQPGSAGSDGEQQTSGDEESTAAPKTPRSTPETREVSGRADRADADDASARASEREAQAGDESGGGAPVGLIAFGAVAGALAVAVAGLAVRRRFRG